MRARISERTGLAPDAILVGCTHTHSGPELGLAVTVAGKPAPTFVAPLLDAIVEAGARAHTTAAPARLAVGCAEARIGRKRRTANGPTDPSVPILRVDAADGSTLAALYVHGCHPTALPLEICVDVGLEWRRRVASLGAEFSSVVSIGNGWLRYLPHPRNFGEEKAHQKDEIQQSTLVPGAAEQLLEVGKRLARLGR